VPFSIPLINSDREIFMMMQPSMFFSNFDAGTCLKKRSGGKKITFCADKPNFFVISILAQTF